MALTLVTGAPGWLGTRLVELLANGMPQLNGLARSDQDLKIRCLVQPGVDAAPLRSISPDIEIVTGDINDTKALGEFFSNAQGATLFHGAGIVHVRHRISELYRVNVDGARAVLAQAEAAGVRRVIVVSSNSPLGFSYRSQDTFDESRDYHPYMNYGRSKMLMERVVQSFQARGRLETVIVRPAWFYGPGQPARQDTFFTMIRRGSAPILGDGRNRRSMTFIDNLCQAMLLCERTDSANGQAYWIADREAYTANEIVDTVERLMEDEFGLPVAHKRLRLPFLASEIAMWMDWMIQRAGFYNQKLHVLGEYNKTIACSIAKAETELGYRPTVELKEGMRRSIAWCLENNRIL